MKLERDAQTMIEEGLDERENEIEEDRRVLRAFDDAMKDAYEKEWKIKKNVVQNYKTKNPHEICSRCYAKNCRLLDEVGGCGYIGKKLEKTYNKKGHRKSYKIIDAQKGVWEGEKFIALTDEQINNMGAIF